MKQPITSRLQLKQPGPPKRVLILCDFFSSLGGTEYYNAALAQGLHELGIDVRVYVGEKPRLKFWINFLDTGNIYYKTPRKFHDSLTDHEIEDDFIANNVADINKWKPDIIHTHPFGKMAIAWLSNSRSNKSVPLVATEWTLPAENSKHWFNPDQHKHIASVSAYIAPCKALKKGIRDFHHYDGRIDVIPHLIFPLKTNQQKPSTNQLSVGCISRLSVEKGLDFLIGAWKEVSRLLPNASLHIYGHGPELEHLSLLRDSLGLKHSVIFAGTFDPFTGIDTIATKHSLFVQPSLFESIPTSLIELMLRSKPVIATNVGGVAELVNETTGILIEPASTDQISRSVMALLNNPARANKIGVAAGVSISETYNYRKNLNDIVKLYTTIMNK